MSTLDIVMPPKLNEPSDVVNVLDKVKLKSLSLSVRAKHVIEGMGAASLLDLVQLPKEKILNQKNCGEKTLAELEKKVGGYGFILGMNKKDIGNHLNSQLNGEIDSRPYVEMSSENAALVRLIEDNFGSGCEENTNSCEHETGKHDYLVHILRLPLSIVRLPVRAFSAFNKLGLKTFFDLIQKTDEDLCGIKNMGKKTVIEIKSLMDSLAVPFGTKICGHVARSIRHRTDPASENASFLKVFKEKYPDTFLRLSQYKEPSLTEAKVSRYKRIFSLYKKLGTLAKVADKEGLTRERIRQLLVKGTKLKLFKYAGIEYPYVAKDQILDAYVRTGALGGTARDLKISVTYLKKLLTAHEITDQKLKIIRLDKAKQRCIKEYRMIKKELGSDPTTTAMQKKPKWRALWARTSRLWGSMAAFRESLAIPQIPRGNPNFNEHMRPWREHKKQMALILRMQHLDDVRDYLKTKGPSHSSDIVRSCELKSQRVSMLMHLLLMTGEVTRDGFGSGTKYKLRGDK